MRVKYAETGDNGRMSYELAKMLALYLYGYMNHVHLSRRLGSESSPARFLEQEKLEEALGDCSVIGMTFRREGLNCAEPTCQPL
jgi:hypothetical protein